MSLEDLFKSESFIPTLMVLFVIFFAIFFPIGLIIAKNKKNSIYGDEEDGETQTATDAKIVALRSTPYSYNSEARINTVVFELPSGERLNFAIKNQALYDTFLEGDTGKLEYIGKKFIKFERNA